MKRFLLSLLAIAFVGVMAVIVSGCLEDALTAPDDAAESSEAAFKKPPKNDGGPAIDIWATVDGPMTSPSFSATEKPLAGGTGLLIENGGYTAHSTTNSFGVDVATDCFLYKAPKKNPNFDKAAFANSWLNVLDASARYYISADPGTQSGDNYITQWFEFEGDFVEVSIKDHPYVPTAPLVVDNGDGTLTYSGGTLQFRSRVGGPRYTYAYTCVNTAEVTVSRIPQ